MSSTAYHDLYFRDGLMILTAWSGRYPENGEVISRAGVRLEHIVSWESLPKRYGAAVGEGWCEGDRYKVYTVDGRVIEMDFTTSTDGDLDAGITPDSGQRFMEFDTSLIEQLASVFNTAVPRRKEEQ